MSSLGKKTIEDRDPIKKKNPTSVKISPWTLARLNGDDVSKAAAEARKRSKILQPVSKSNRIERERDRSFGRSNREGSRKIGNDRVREESSSGNLVPLQLEARSVYRAMSMSSPDNSSLDMESPDIQPFMGRGGDNDVGVGLSGVVENQGILALMRSMSDGYDASGGEDSDRIPSKFERKI